MDLHRITVVIPALVGSTLQRLLRPARSGAMLVAGAAGDLTRTRSELLAENALRRQQVIVLQRGNERPRLHRDDRLLLLVLARLSRGWRDTLHVVRADTLLRWHRDLFKFSGDESLAPNASQVDLRRRSSRLFGRWPATTYSGGAERIRGELLKLGIRISKRTSEVHERRAGAR